MSKNINLVKYKTGDDGRLYETKTELIETAYISPTLHDELLKDWPLVKKSIFESAGSEERYLIECFDDSQIANALCKLKEIFKLVLKSDSEKLLGEVGGRDLDQLTVVSDKNVQPKELEESIIRFRTLTNVINVFALKHNQYGNDDSVVLKIG